MDILRPRSSDYMKRRMRPPVDAKGPLLEGVWEFSGPGKYARWENTLIGAGRSELVDLGLGRSTDYYDNANATVELLDGGGTVLFSRAGCDAGFPDHSTQGQVVWQWTDTSTSSYTVDTARMFNQGSTGGVKFSEGSGGPFSQGNSKAGTDDWEVKYTLKIATNDTSFGDAGLDAWLQMMTDSFSNGERWDAATTVAEVTDTGSGTTSVLACDEGFPTHPDTILGHWEFTAHPGEAVHAWDEVAVVGQFSGGDVILRTDSDKAFGTKPSEDSWTYVYEFTG